MTFAELKKEADRQGYHLVPKSNSVMLCPFCGKKPRYTWTYSANTGRPAGTIEYWCEGHGSTTHKRISTGRYAFAKGRKNYVDHLARNKWNELIEKYSREESGID